MIPHIKRILFTSSVFEKTENIKTDMTRISLVLLLISFVFISCRSQDLIRPGDTLEVAYNKAFAQYQNENYSQAADAFETVISIGRGTTIGQDAQYYLAESYFNSERYLMAASEYQRYVQFHPNSERRQERSEEHTSELQSRGHLVCRLL